VSNIICCGRREEGKTSLAIAIAKQRHAAVIAFDPRAMIVGVPVYGVDDLEEVIADGAWREHVICYRFDSGDIDTELEEMCEFLFPPRFTKGAFALVIDEAGSQKIQTFHKIHPALDRAVRQHPTRPPEYAVTIIQTSHRLADFHGASKSLMDELYIFNTSSPRDIEALEDHTQMPDLVEIVRVLPKHHCVRYLYARQEEGVAQYEVWDKPEEWYIPATSHSGVLSAEDENNKEEENANHAAEI
jgi:hypothetical protein